MARIILIEDDETFRDMLGKVLEKMGHTVVLATNGTEGVALYWRERADLVITDLIMPEKEGLETIMEIKRMDSSAKILAISGGGRLGPEDHLRFAAKMGAQRVLAKPFKHEDFQIVVNEMLGGKSAG